MDKALIKIEEQWTKDMINGMDRKDARIKQLKAKVDFYVESGRIQESLTIKWKLMVAQNF